MRFLTVRWGITLMCSAAIMTMSMEMADIPVENIAADIIAVVTEG